MFHWGWAQRDWLKRVCKYSRWHVPRGPDLTWNGEDWNYSFCAAFRRRVLSCSFFCFGDLFLEIKCCCWAKKWMSSIEKFAHNTNIVGLVTQTVGTDNWEFSVRRSIHHKIEWLCEEDSLHVVTCNEYRRLVSLRSAVLPLFAVLEFTTMAIGDSHEPATALSTTPTNIRASQFFLLSDEDNDYGWTRPRSQDHHEHLNRQKWMMFEAFSTSLCHGVLQNWWCAFEPEYNWCQGFKVLDYDFRLFN